MDVVTAKGQVEIPRLLESEDKSMRIYNAAEIKVTAMWA